MKIKYTPNQLFKYFTQDVFIAHKSLLGSVELTFKESELVKGNFPVIHSLKVRMKDESHLKEKISRKLKNGKELTPANILSAINDIAGIRVLHVHGKQFKQIHELIMRHANSKTVYQLHEDPKAYTWDPDSVKYFQKLGIEVELKETYYTSVHYVVKPNATSQTYCEIQVRTLLEETWGEMDHAMNYPHPTKNIAIKEQLKALAKLIGAGTRLSDSIFHSYESDCKILSKNENLKKKAKKKQLTKKKSSKKRTKR